MIWALITILAVMASPFALVFLVVGLAWWIAGRIEKRRRVRGAPLSREERKQFEQVWQRYESTTADEPGRKR